MEFLTDIVRRSQSEMVRSENIAFVRGRDGKNDWNGAF